MKNSNDTEISKELMLDRCTAVCINFLFAGSLCPCWPSWGSGLPSLAARYFSDKQNCVQGRQPPHMSPHRPRQTHANRFFSTMCKFSEHINRQRQPQKHPLVLKEQGGRQSAGCNLIRAEHNGATHWVTSCSEPWALSRQGR